MRVQVVELVAQVADSVRAREGRELDGREDADRLPEPSMKPLPESPGIPGVAV